MSLYERKSRVEEYVQLGRRLGQVAEEEDTQDIQKAVLSLEEILGEIKDGIKLNETGQTLRLLVNIGEGRKTELGELGIENLKKLGMDEEEARARVRDILEYNGEGDTEGVSGNELYLAKFYRVLGYLCYPIRGLFRLFNKSAELLTEHAELVQEKKRLLNEYAEAEKAKKTAIFEYNATIARRETGKAELVSMIMRNSHITEEEARRLAEKPEVVFIDVLDEFKIKYNPLL